MLRRRNATVVFHTLAAIWFALATLVGHAFHLHEHTVAASCSNAADHGHGAGESTSLVESFGNHAPSGDHDDACPACVFLAHSQMATGGSPTVARVCLTEHPVPDQPHCIAQDAAHAFDSRGPPCSLLIA